MAISQTFDELRRFGPYFGDALSTLGGTVFPTQTTAVLDSTATLSLAPKSSRAIVYDQLGPEAVVTIQIDESQSAWLQPAIERLFALAKLKPCWDSYDSKSVSRASLAASLRVLVDVMSPGVPVPQIVPTTRGTIQLEWHANGIDIEVDAISQHEVCVSIDDESNELSCVDEDHTDNLSQVEFALSILKARNP